MKKELMNPFGVQHCLSTAYHPQVNGLAKFALVNRETWDVKVSEVVYAYNTAVQTSTKHTPYKAMFGRMAGLPVDFNASSNYDANAKLKDVETDDSLECATKHQKKHSKQTLSKHKVHYDLKHGAAACFNVGSMALRQDFTCKKHKDGKGHM